MARFTDETYLKQWRQRQVEISASAAMAWRIKDMIINIEDNDKDRTPEAIEGCMKIFENVAEVFVDKVDQSIIEDDKAYKLQYLRNYTHAYYLTVSRRKSREDFFDYFRDDLWASGDILLKEKLGKEHCEQERIEGHEMSRYIEATVHMYCNRLLNLAQHTDRWEMDDADFIAEFKQMHEGFEEQKLFDEIAVIRYQLIQAVKADCAELMLDEAAARVFQVDAFDLMNEFNTKPMQVDMAR